MFGLTVERQQNHEQALHILDFLAQVYDLRRDAFVYDMPLGTVLGTKQNVFLYKDEQMTQDVNTALVSMGGILTVVERSSGQREEATLMEWFGPDAERPQHHVWLTKQGRLSIHLHELLQKTYEKLQG